MLVNDGVPGVDIPRRHMTDDTTFPHKQEETGSQESIASAASNSSIFSAPGLPSSSNVSTSTAAETDFASSATSYPPSSQSKTLERAVPPSPTQTRGHNAQFAPPIDDAVNATRTGDTAASPMLLESPLLAQGCKRTANGMIKGAGPAADSDVARTSSHKRTKSTESGANRIGELSAQLRTRLSYAMVKVQNGWEKRSLDDLEDETSTRGSPIPASSRVDSARPIWGSPPDSSRQRRPSAISDVSDQVMLSPNGRSPPQFSRSHGANASSGFRPTTSQSSLSAFEYAVPVTVTSNGAVLAPAAEIGSRRKRRSSASFPPPPLLSSAQRKHYSDLGASPHKAMNSPRPGILRMPSQQAEKDAVDTLLFLSSPNNSGRFPPEARAGPPKSDIPSRRVWFENHVSKEQPPDGRQPNRAIDSHP